MAGATGAVITHPKAGAERAGVRRYGSERARPWVHYRGITRGG